MINDCTKAVQFKSTRLVDAYNNRGIAYKSLGNYTQAFADYDGWQMRGICYQALGDTAKAQATSQKPGNSATTADKLLTMTAKRIILAAR